MDNRLKEVHRDLITANHILDNHGVVDAYGHISARHPLDSSKYIMCGYMAPALVSNSSDLIEYHISDSSTVDPNAAKGYSERFIHGELYKRFPGVNYVIHSHAEDVLPYVVSGVPMRAVYHMAGFLGDKVPVFDIDLLYDEKSQRDMLVNNSRLGAGLASCFAASESSTSPDHSVVLMRKHGFTTQAKLIQTAVYRAIYTKINAKALTDSLAAQKNFGGEMVFDAGDLGLTDDQTKGCTVMNETFQEKPWRLWVREVNNRGLYVNRLA